MQNITKELPTDILFDHNIFGEKMTEICTCLSHPCQNEGTCISMVGACQHPGGAAGPHFENGSTEIVERNESCITDDQKCVAMEPDGSYYVIGTT